MEDEFCFSCFNEDENILNIDWGFPGRNEARKICPNFLKQDFVVRPKDNAMEQSQKTALRKCRVQLVEDLSMDHIRDTLESTDIFTPLMLETIQAEKSRPSKVRTLLDYLQRRGPGAFGKFLQCLRATGHDFLANILVAAELEERGEPIPHELQAAIDGGQSRHQLSPLLQGSSTQESQDVEMPSSGVQESSLNTSSQGQDERGAVHAEMNTMQSPVPPNPSTAGVQATQGYSGDIEEEYRMETDPRGLLLIINNRDFQPPMKPRQGTDLDCSRLKELFLLLGFGVDVKHNLTATEIYENLKELSQLEQLYRVDSLAVAILTHGSEEIIYGVDGQSLFIKDAIDPFSARNCPALHNKPKLFIINACRGDLKDQGSLVLRTCDGRQEECLSDITEPLFPRPMPDMAKNIPSLQDFIIAYSTTPNNVSWRHLHEGSWFIQSIVNVFSELAGERSVTDMLIRVNREVCQKFSGPQRVQIPAPQIMLTYRWFLNPITSTPFSVSYM